MDSLMLIRLDGAVLRHRVVRSMTSCHSPYHRPRHHSYATASCKALWGSRLLLSVRGFYFMCTISFCSFICLGKDTGKACQLSSSTATEGMFEPACKYINTHKKCYVSTTVIEQTIQTAMQQPQNTNCPHFEWLANVLHQNCWAKSKNWYTYIHT